MNVVIIGNSGSGKTWLATRLAACDPATVIHLDHLFWEPGGFDRKRNNDDVASLIKESKNIPPWVVEGVFGELAEWYLAEAAALIWLDLGWPQCRQRLEQRGSESKQHMARAQSEAGLNRLIAWASNYYSRHDSRSFQGHLNLFIRHTGIRIRLRSEEEVNALIEDAQRRTPTKAFERAAES